MPFLAVCDECNMEAMIIRGKVVFEPEPLALDTERKCRNCGADMVLETDDEFVCPECGERMLRDEDALFEREYREMTSDYDRKPDLEDEMFEDDD
jgi:predicted RNA-binding Zn-ribbon protein involved in translation (DUF1610 family)